MSFTKACFQQAVTTPRPRLAMGCIPSTSKVYIAPLKTGDDDSVYSGTRDVAVDRAAPLSPNKPRIVTATSDKRTESGPSSTLVRNSTDGTNTRLLAIRQISLSASLPHESRLLVSYPSRRAVIGLPNRIRRFSIAAESYQIAAEFARARSGSSLPDENNSPVYPKTDEEKTFIISAISKSFLFEGLQVEDVATIVDAMHPVAVANGEIVFKQGDAGTEFYIVESGTLNVVVDSSVVSTLTPERHFGELALMHNCPRNASVIATSEAVLWALDRRTFKTVVVSSAAYLIQSKANFLKTMEVLSSMTIRQHYRLAEASSFVEFKEGEVIIEQDGEGVFFYMIKSGEVSVLKNSETVDSTGAPFSEMMEVLRLGPGQYFGEQALLHNHRRLATVRAESDVVCLCLHKDFFLQMFSDLTTRTSLDTNHTKREEKEISKAVDENLPKLRLRVDSPTRSFEAPVTPAIDTTNIRLSELSNIAVLGEGAFGTVRLVKHEATNTCYALKVMQKSRIVEMSQQRNVIMEKNIMLRANHPYILRLHRTFQDRNCLYMLLEFCQGGDMFALLGRQGGRIDSFAARHYAAVVTTVLDYLHGRAVAYRDLKPENLVFDSAGHLKVVDFGFAKIVRDRTYTLCGTPEYLSPELVQGSGHHHGVDCWALGILIYEMLSGYSPFADREHNNQLTIYRNIIAGRYAFPSFLLDEAAKDIVRRFLVAKDSKRLGCMKGGFKDVQAHVWFEGFDWDALLNMTIPPPLVPKFSGPTDLSLFDEVAESNGKIVPYIGDSTDWEAEFG